MKLRWRVFFGWIAILAPVMIFANWGVSLKNWIHWAGFPWTFACWVSGRLQWFDALALSADLIVGLSFVIGISAFWARPKHVNSGSGNTSTEAI